MPKKSKFGLTTWRQFGYLEGLRKSRNWARKQAKKAKELLEIAKRDEGNFGIYDNCGCEYITERDRKEGALNLAVLLKIQYEKFHKAERERLCELNPKLKVLINKISHNYQLEQNID